MVRWRRWAWAALGAFTLESVGMGPLVRPARAQDASESGTEVPPDEGAAFTDQNEVPVGTDAVYEPSGPVTFDTFYDSLSPYGEWIDFGRYGLVWRPYAEFVGDDFRPYATGGQWVYTAFGWSFVSGFPWGWAPFHYGRWIFDPNLGWIWVPGYVWGPAWVDWRFGGGYVGWAPLPPVDYGDYVSSFYPWWCFVGVSVFPFPHVHQHLLPRRDLPHAFGVTRPVRDFAVVHGHRAWRGPPPREVGRFTGVRVPEVPVRRVSDPRVLTRVAPGRPPVGTVVPPKVATPPAEGRRVPAPSTTGPRTQGTTPRTVPSPSAPRLQQVPTTPAPRLTPAPRPPASTPAPTAVVPPAARTPPSSPRVVKPPAARPPTTVAPPIRVPATPAPSRSPTVVTPPTTVPRVVAPPMTAPRVVTPPTTVPRVVAPPTTSPRVVTPPPTAPRVVAPPTTAPRVVAPPTTVPRVVAPPTTPPRVVTPPSPPRVVAPPVARPPTTVTPPVRLPSTPSPVARPPTVVAPPAAAPGARAAPPAAPHATPMATPHAAPAAPGHVGGGGAAGGGGRH